MRLFIFLVGRAIFLPVPVQDSEMVTVPLLVLPALHQHWGGEGRTGWAENGSQFVFGTKGGPSRVVAQQG